MTEFYCMENGHLIDRTLVSTVDRTLLTDVRVLENLLKQEELRIANTDYFSIVQTEVKPAMRKIVSSWMLEVCEDQRCENAVFPMAMNYFDRFLSVVNVQKSHLQLLGGVCLLVSSKFRQNKAITIENIIDYTDFSVTREEILNWELLLLSKLKWNMSAIIPDDFIDHLLNRLNIHDKHALKVRKHAAIFISLSLTDHHFLEFSPSVLASACIAASAHGLATHIQQPWSSLSDLLRRLHFITLKPVESIKSCYEKVEQLVRENMSPVQEQYEISYSLDRSSGMTATNKNAQMELASDQCPMQPETPTDVHDVSF